MLDLDLTRRDFLKSSRNVLVGTLATSTGVLAMLAPSQTWALELTNLDKTTAQALLQAARQIFPHDTMDDAVYSFVVKDLDAAAAKDEAVEALLNNGVALLNADAGGDWLAANSDKQFAIIEKMAGSEFFEKIRGTAVVSLYNNELAWAHFGYEGDAWKHGGYLNRGFDDLKWLPDPPAAASPAAYSSL
ncbi:MAG: tat (twin-arginine translocation) pathway signal sequence [Gammaproteobacteria bacterium]